MLPDNLLSSEILRDQFLFPDNIVGTALEDYEMGGIDIQDPSQGLRVQPWYGVWKVADSTAYLQANFDGPPIPLFSTPDVIEFTFTFDQNMRWVAATLSSTGVLSFRWYDASVPGYVTTTYSNITTAKLALDDKRPLQVLGDSSDIVLTYVDTSGNLYARIQRERYLTAHLLDTGAPNNFRITNFGMNTKYRMQWRFQNRLGA